MSIINNGHRGSKVHVNKIQYCRAGHICLAPHLDIKTHLDILFIGVYSSFKELLRLYDSGI